MATSSILGGERAPVEPKGTDEDSLGPSDSSDSGSDAAGTGSDRAAAEAGLEEPIDSDILPDRIGVFSDAAQEVFTTVDDPDAANVEELADDIEAEGRQQRERLMPLCPLAPHPRKGRWLRASTGRCAMYSVTRDIAAARRQ